MKGHPLLTKRETAASQLFIDRTVRTNIAYVYQMVNKPQGVELRARRIPKTRGASGPAGRVRCACREGIGGLTVRWSPPKRASAMRSWFSTSGGGTARCTSCLIGVIAGTTVLERGTRTLPHRVPRDHGGAAVGGTDHVRQRDAGGSCCRCGELDSWVRGAGND